MADLIPMPVTGSRLTMTDRFRPVRSFFDQPAVRGALPAIGGIGALAIAAAAWFTFQTPAQRPVFDSLPESDKAAVASALDTSGIAYHVDSSTGAVTVADSDYHRARMLLAGQGLPKAAPSAASQLSAMPMGASRAVEGETLKSAREADLSRTIEAIDVVKSARVHLASADPSPFLRDEPKATASVMLTLQPNRDLTSAQVRAIQHLVASSLPDLNAEDVSIVDQGGKLVSAADGMDDRNMALQNEIEARARRSLAALLSPLVGVDGYTAEVHADLDLSESQSTRESYPKDDRALRSEVGVRTVAGGANGPAAGGIPGALSNTPPLAATASTTPPVPVAATAAGPATTPASSEENYNRSFDVGREISVTHQPVGRLKRLSVAVAIKAGAKPRTAAEIAQLDSLVKGAIGFDATRGDTVAIAARPFIEAAEVKPAFYEAPWFMPVVRQVLAILGALLAFFLIGRPLKKMMKNRAARTVENDKIAGELLKVTGAPQREITLEMIEAAPSYETKANLVRAFVRQDSVKAASVVRELLKDGARA
ncbi:Flagellar M-ring protein [Sphingomonas antarctica]|uniref:flagellar basal-body MS-ring/collar protein FliF n=1 Tax=Sphingomonas antarctica TaxID=2040274 RepID=UPI0039E89F69